MSDKKTNDIIEEQRKARAEFLKLKQMQKGELAPEPKPSEIAYKPKTFKEKVANFWFQYKVHTIVTVLVVAVLAVCIAQCASRVESDLEIVYFSYNTVLDQQLDGMADYFEKYAQDINGDGKVNVTILNCGYSENNNNYQYRNTMIQKLQAALVANEKALLFITDEESIKYFDNISGAEDMFEGEPYLLGERFYKETASKDFGELPKGLQISCRNISGKAIEKNKDIKIYYDASKELIKALKE